MREDHAELLARVGPETLLGLYGCRLMSKDECLESRALFGRVDERGEWFGASWQPFLQDPGGSVTCIDTSTGAIIYHDKMAPPLLVAPSLAAYLQVVEAVLVKLPDPPDPEEDDVVEEELEDRFERALRKPLIASAKPAPKPRPRRKARTE